MSSIRPLRPTGLRVALMLLASALLAGSATAEIGVGPTAGALGAPTVARTGGPVGGDIPGRLTDPKLGLRAGPVAVPLALELPSLGVTASVIGVGLTPKNVMDAPTGPAGDPVWQQAFWYRGSAVPGATSTALIAGHIDGPQGAPAVFGHIDALQPGDPIVVRDTRTGLGIRFSVTESQTYPLDAASDPAVLTRIYGRGPVAGTRAQPSADGLAHLTLITCAGTFRNGTHDHRLVVFATRTA
jgi:Sortase domain